MDYETFANENWETHSPLPLICAPLLLLLLLPPTFCQRSNWRPCVQIVTCIPAYTARRPRYSKTRAAGICGSFGFYRTTSSNWWRVVPICVVNGVNGQQWQRTCRRPLLLLLFQHIFSPVDSADLTRLCHHMGLTLLAYIATAHLFYCLYNSTRYFIYF